MFVKHYKDLYRIYEYFVIGHRLQRSFRFKETTRIRNKLQNFRFVKRINSASMQIIIASAEYEIAMRFRL